MLGYEDMRVCGYKLTEKQTPHEMLKKLFGPLRERYANRPGGYTRVLRIEPLKEDQAPSAILELVDGPKDMRFAMTARTVAHLKRERKELNEMTKRNVEKVTQFRKNGKRDLNSMVRQMKSLGMGDRSVPVRKEWVYPTHQKEKEEKENLKKKKAESLFGLRALGWMYRIGVQVIFHRIAFINRRLLYWYSTGSQIYHLCP